MDEDQFRRIVKRARLAPSVHNTQPARWRLSDWTIELWCDTSVGLSVGDPTGRDAALSCGAALEATVLAMQAEGIGVELSDTWGEAAVGQYLPVARLDLRGAGAADPLAEQLERRFTHRGTFGAKTLRDWARPDIVLVADEATKMWLARLNDKASLQIMRNKDFRDELLAWTRLDGPTPVDGMSREAMRMSPFIAKMAAKVLGPWWPMCDRLGLTGMILSETKDTLSSAAIACFHRPIDENPIATGRAYLRMWLEATQRDMAGWPMAALSDVADSNAEICTRLAIPDSHRLVQVLRFGQANQSPPPRARLDLAALILKDMV